MAKMGLIHDYDLMANAEPTSNGVVCAVCETPNTAFQWSDCSGQAMCQTCGCPYQLKWGSDAQKSEGKYPYMVLRDDFLPIAREFWNETKTWVHYGMSLTRNDGHRELDAWIKERYPDFGKESGTGEQSK